MNQRLLFDSFQTLDVNSIVTLISTNQSLVEEIVKDCREAFIPIYSNQNKDLLVKEIISKYIPATNEYEAVQTKGTLLFSFIYIFS